METPLSTRRVTRSQTAAASASSVNNNTLISKRSDESDSKSRQRNNGSKLQQQETTKYALLDITNNSPIVGLAMGNLLNTPSSSSCFAKKSSSRRKIISTTPGSGEALLRDQVKTLLQKVEEEAELSKVSVESRPLFQHHFQGFVHSPMGLLLAPTPTNTPQVLTTSEGLQTATFPDAAYVNLISSSKVVVNEDILDDALQQQEEEESMESQKSQITRSLLLDFSDKSEVIDSLSEEDCCSELTAEQGKEKEVSAAEEDSASAWSVQVNASSTRDEDEVVDFEKEDENVEEDGGWSVVVDELCLGIENMGIIIGKHKRFVYNSDDEMVAEEEELNKLKGLPTPKGKHIRFDEEEDEEKKEDADSANNN